MRLKWTESALADLDDIKTFIHQDNPAAAKRVARKILTMAKSLAKHPYRGKIGKLFDTRELVVPDLPYLIAYRVTREQVEILRVIHTARQWPE